MKKTRRSFIRDIGYASIGATLAANQRGSAGGAEQSTGARGEDFDINKAFADFMRNIGGTASDAGGKVTFTGRDPIVRSHFRLGACMALPAMAAGVGAAAIWRERTGEGQDAKVDLRESIYNINPIITLIMRHRQAVGSVPADDAVAKNFSFVPTVNGHWHQAPLGVGNPMSFGVFDTKDGRKMGITDIYPHLGRRALNVLGAVPNRESVIKAVKQWDAVALDDALAAARAVGGIHRTADEWARHPEGQNLAKTPLIDIHKVGDSDPIPFAPNPTQPLSGIKSLALTHVIAGSCAARTLAEYGTEVLHIARDQSFEHEAFVTEVNVGMRSTFLDLQKPEQKQVLMLLVPKADVFIDSFSGRGVEGLGFGVEEVARKRPGIVYLTIRAYSWDGPWKTRAGFDMEGLTVTGFTMAEGGGKTPALSCTYPLPEGEGSAPAFPQTLVLNDFIAGYLGAAGVIAALRRRAKEGGSYHVRVNLARTGMWFMSLGSFPTTDFEPDPDQRMIPPETLTRPTPYGEIHRLAPQVKLSRTPGRWREPLVTVRGSDRPTWEG